MRITSRLTALAAVAVTALGLTAASATAASLTPAARSVPPGAAASDPGRAARPPAASGTRLWLARYGGIGTGAIGLAEAVSPDGTKAFVTGYLWATGAPGPIMTTVAYRS